MIEELVSVPAPSCLGVVNEVLPFAGVGRQRSRAGVLEALDDGRLAAPVRPQDHGQRRVELDSLFCGSPPPILQRRNNHWTSETDLVGTKLRRSEDTWSMV